MNCCNSTKSDRNHRVRTNVKERNEVIGRCWYEEMRSKPDLEMADEFVDKDYDPDWVHIEAVGPAQIKHEIKYFRSIFPNLKYEIVDIIGEDDKAGFDTKERGPKLVVRGDLNQLEKKSSLKERLFCTSTLRARSSTDGAHFVSMIFSRVWD